MDQIADHGIIQLIPIHDVPVQESALAPADLTTALLVDHQPAAQLIRLDLQEAGQLLQVHGGVEFEVGFEGGGGHGGADVGHEDGQVVLDRVHVHGRVVEVGRGRGDEFGAGGAEVFLEEGEGVRAAALEPGELVAVFVAEGGVDGVVELGGVEGDADGDEGVHLVVLLRDAVVLGCFLEVLGAGDVDEDVGEHADGVGVAAEHEVGEADVVVGREMGGHDAREHGFFVEFDVVERFEGEAEVAEEAVDA